MGPLGSYGYTLKRQASYLLDVVSPDASRRRSRQKGPSTVRVRQRDSYVTAADRRNIEINNAIPADLKTPPMFPAELTSVFFRI